MQRAEGFGQSPPYVIQGGPSAGDKGPGDRDDGLQGHRTSKQHYRGAWKQKTPLITDAILNTGGWFFMICADVEVISPSGIRVSNHSGTVRGNPPIFVSLCLILQHLHSSASTSIPPVRITKANLIPVESRRKAVVFAGCSPAEARPVPLSLVFAQLLAA